MSGFLGGYWEKKFFIGGLVCLVIGALLVAGTLSNATSLASPEKAFPLAIALGFVVCGILLLRHWRVRKNSPEKKLTQGFLGGYWSRKYILGGIACLIASAAFIYDGATGGNLFYAQNSSNTGLDESEAVLAIILNFLGPYGFAAIFFCLGFIGIRIGMLNKERLESLENLGQN